MTPATTPADGGLTLDANEVQFLAARLRRLFNHFAYPLPDFAKDDRHLIGIAPTCIGAVLANLNADRATPSPTAVPTFIGSNVRVKSMCDGKIMVTMLFDGFEPAPQYAVQPINPAAVRVATPSPGKADAEDAARYRWIAENAIVETAQWRNDGRDPASTKHVLDRAIDAAIQQERDKQ